MKKILGLSFLALAIVGTGCLKDKGFEDQNYGLQVQDSRAVSFPQSRSVSSILYGIVSSVNPDTLVGPIVGLEVPEVQSTDTHITLGVDDALVTADPNLTVMPASEYSIDFNRIIRAGQRFDTLSLITLHSANLNPNLIYGIGLTIVSADNGFVVASNMKTLVLKFGVKNKYDGVYEVTPGIGSTIGGFSDLQGGAAYTANFPQTIRLVTTGPSSVDVQRYLNVTGTPIWMPGYTFLASGANTFYGNFGLTMTFDPLTDEIIDVHNYYGDPTKALTPVGDPSQGSGAPDYKAAGPRFRQIKIDATGVNAWSQPDPNVAPVVDIKYVQIDATFAGYPSPRVYFDEHWEYTGPRP